MSTESCFINTYPFGNDKHQWLGWFMIRSQKYRTIYILQNFVICFFLKSYSVNKEP